MHMISCCLRHVTESLKVWNQKARVHFNLFYDVILYVLWCNKAALDVTSCNNIRYVVGGIEVVKYVGYYAGIELDDYFVVNSAGLHICANLWWYKMYVSTRLWIFWIDFTPSMLQKWGQKLIIHRLGHCAHTLNWRENWSNKNPKTKRWLKIDYWSPFFSKE